MSANLTHANPSYTAANQRFSDGTVLIPSKQDK
jgi:hypothetical protein